jgi:hypothetical protein
MFVYYKKMQDDKQILDRIETLTYILDIKRKEVDSLINQVNSLLSLYNTKDGRTTTINPDNNDNTNSGENNLQSETL